MSKRISLLTGAAGLRVSHAWAQYYIGAQAGWTGLPYQTDTIDRLGSVLVQFSAGYNVGVRGGYQSGPWRFEGEYSYRHNDVTEYNESTKRACGNRHIHSIMTNVLYDFTTGWPITPHFGVGIGAMRVFDGLSVPSSRVVFNDSAGNSVIRRSLVCAMRSTSFSPSISTTAIWRRPNRHSGSPIRAFATGRAPTQTTSSPV